jgi:deoxyribodipyrimidine photo-lyase
MSSPIVLHWFRRDLRLTDNIALHHATAGGNNVVPVYILSTWKKKHNWTGSTRQQFLCGSVASLAKNLETLGSRLLFRAGAAEVELERLAGETGATAIYWNRDYDPHGRQVEERVQQMCVRRGISFHHFKDSVMHEAGEVLTGGGQPYRVYTPYSRNWLSQPKAAPLPVIKSLGVPPGSTLTSLPVPTLDYWELPPCTADIPEPGERAARDRMKNVIDSGIIARYSEKRDTPGGQTTSRLGQDLRFGLISIRELYARALSASGPAASIQTYIKELAWREFYMAILWHYPEVFGGEFNPDFRGIAWTGSDEDFQRWCQGKTGFPIVDAGMRELLGSGFIHNRVRMIVSMFLTKDLHCHWKLGESHFMQHLVDGENASNNGGWQWSAGTGADAAPYFRIQNPWTQTKRYDPEGTYIKKWVPELRDVPPQRLMEPPAPGLSLAPGYPAPMVDHATERDRCLAMFARHRGKV